MNKSLILPSRLSTVFQALRCPVCNEDLNSFQLEVPAADVRTRHCHSLRRAAKKGVQTGNFISGGIEYTNTYTYIILYTVHNMYIYTYDSMYNIYIWYMILYPEVSLSLVSL